VLITPKNAIEIVLERKAKNYGFSFYETPTQKWLFLLAAGSLTAGSAIALLAYFWKNQYVVLAALLGLLISMLLATAYQVATILPELTKLRNVERDISDPLLIEFNNDMDLVNELVQICEPHHLRYAKARYLLMAKQLRERIAILVGALEKVGIIPLAIAGYFSFINAQKEGLVPFGGVEWVLVSFLFLYLFALRMTAAAQWMEKVSEIYEQAIALILKR
jgi:hypothetical protein